MAWQAITDVDIEPGKLVFSRVWRSFIDNPEAVHAGDLGSVPSGKRILIDNQASPPSATAGQILLCSTTGAELVTDSQQIDTIAPFFFWDTVGTLLWVVPVSAWYEIQVHGGGAGGKTVGPPAPPNAHYFNGVDGGWIRVMQFLPAGMELTIVVGSGGTVGNSGSLSQVQALSAGLQVSSGGGPFTNAYVAPWPTAETSVNGGAIVLVDAPGHEHLGIPGGGPSGGGAGFGGVPFEAGVAGCVVIERVSFGG